MYSKSEINNAGDVLRNRDKFSIEQVQIAESVLTAYRMVHIPIINTFQANMRSKLKKFKMSGIVAQRLKRLSSIIFKLDKENNMRLSRMQDIAGIRIILKSISSVLSFENVIVSSRFKHELLTRKDYINDPKPSGYRGIHLVYKYSNARFPDANGLRIEVQIRTELQHTWATTVETLGTFMDYFLKSSLGPAEILDFFALTSSAFATIEKSPRLCSHNNYSELELYKEVVRRFDDLDIESKLSGFTVAANHITSKHFNDAYYLIVLNFESKKVRISNYSKKLIVKAAIKYGDIEREIEAGAKMQAVLISLDEIRSLRKAYPNYFLDTRQFTKVINSIRDKIVVLETSV